MKSGSGSKSRYIRTIEPFFPFFMPHMSLPRISRMFQFRDDHSSTRSEIDSILLGKPNSSLDHGRPILLLLPGLQRRKANRDLKHVSRIYIDFFAAVVVKSHVALRHWE